MSPESDYYRRVTDLIEELRPGLPAEARPVMRGRARLGRLATFAVVALFALAALTYIGDYAVARYRLAHGSALATVELARMYAIPQKSGKTELDYGGAETDTCVRSLFPHFGYSPCWYLTRNGGVQY
jgi:hypothetical protein